MTDIDLIRRKAAELGFGFSKGLTRFSGYTLTNNATGEVLVGPEASLKKIEEFLANVLDDIGIHDFEVGSGESSKALPTKAEIQKSLQGYAKKNEIESILEPPPSTLQEQRRRIALDRLVSTGTHFRSAMAFDRLSDAEKEAHFARLRAARAEEERIKAAQLPTPVTPIRKIGINPDHPFAKEKARQGRVFHKANERWKTNLASLRDYDRADYREDALMNGDETPEEIWQEERERYENFQPPEKGTYTTPNSATKVTVISKNPRRVSKADRPIRKLRWAIRDAIERKDFPAAGAMLKKVKDDHLDHGDFKVWVEREIGISIRSAERYMNAARAKAA
jgi:hypothetical protein